MPTAENATETDERQTLKARALAPEGPLTTRPAATLPPALPRSPQRSLLMPAIFLFLVSSPAVYSLHTASQELSPWILLAYLFVVWAAGIFLAFRGRRGLRSSSKSGWSSRV